jgi:hypothetical protein
MVHDIVVVVVVFSLTAVYELYRYAFNYWGRAAPNRNSAH